MADFSLPYGKPANIAGAFMGGLQGVQDYETGALQQQALKQKVQEEKQMHPVKVAMAAAQYWDATKTTLTPETYGKWREQTLKMFGGLIPESEFPPPETFKSPEQFEAFKYQKEMKALQLKAQLKGLEPYNLQPGAQRMVGNQVVAENPNVPAGMQPTQLLTPQGELGPKIPGGTQVKILPKEEKPTLLQDASGNLISWRPGMPLEGLTKPQAGTMSTAGKLLLLQGIKSGLIPPSMLPKRGGANYMEMLTLAAENGIDLAQLERKYKSAETWAKNLRSAQTGRLMSAGESVVKTIDRLKETAKELNQSGITVLNRAKLAEAINLEGNSPRGKLAGKFLTDLALLKDETGQLVMGGYAPSEQAFKIAEPVLNPNYGGELLISNLDEMQKLVNYRINAIKDMQAESVGGSTTRDEGGGGRAGGGQPQPRQPAKTMPAPNGGQATYTGNQTPDGFPIYKLPDGTFRPWKGGQ